MDPDFSSSATTRAINFTVLPRPMYVNNFILQASVQGNCDLWLGSITFTPYYHQGRVHRRKWYLKKEIDTILLVIRKVSSTYWGRNVILILIVNLIWIPIYLLHHNGSYDNSMFLVTSLESVLFHVRFKALFVSLGHQLLWSFLFWFTKLWDQSNN